MCIGSRLRNSSTHSTIWTGACQRRIIVFTADRLSSRPCQAKFNPVLAEVLSMYSLAKQYNSAVTKASTARTLGVRRTIRQSVVWTEWNYVPMGSSRLHLQDPRMAHWGRSFAWRDLFVYMCSPIDFIFDPTVDTHSILFV